MDLSRDVDRAESRLKAAGAEQYEIMALHTDSVTVSVRQGQVDSHEASLSQGLAIRVIHQGRPGFAFVIGSDGDDALELAAGEALQSAAASDPEPGLGLAGRPGQMAQPDVFDPAVPDDPLEAKIQRAREMAEQAKAADSRVVHVHPSEFSSQVSHLHLRTSNGLDLAHRSSRVSAGCMAMASEGGQSEMGWESHSACHLEDLDHLELGRRAGLQAAAYLGAGPVGDGRYDIILENSVAVQFLSILAESLRGDNLLKGRSMLAGKEGSQVLAAGIDVIDDGLYPRGVGSAPFDDEGTPQKRNVLISRGVLRGLVYDRLWANRAGVESTGNALRMGLKAPPGVGFTNLHIAPGSGGLEDLARAMGKGLIIREVLGAHTADPVSGEFSFGASGHLVEGGQVTRPVKSIAIAGQILDIFKSVAQVGDDIRFFGRSGSPALLVEGVSVSGP